MLTENFNKLLAAAKTASSCGHAGVLEVRVPDILKMDEIHPTPVTEEQLLSWIGQDNTQQKCVELLLKLVNGQYCQVDLNTEISH
ncbi:hypothetical protein [Hydrogenovibrio marinus]|uniref:Uncharacterized protein n=1 Tax=Hydrogenovibrio marinus TaxID=28885 RepID=A0A066ZLM6_HYDMR|nr:hypothetical protein [Hydrogenovibrio marinus]KDN94688.1 hypothetical protein EI16_12375 [Hydrogenovibrio marinus]